MAAPDAGAARGHLLSRRFFALIPGEDKPLMVPLLERLHELGYREGVNLKALDLAVPPNLLATADEMIE